MNKVTTFTLVAATVLCAHTSAPAHAVVVSDVIGPVDASFATDSNFNPYRAGLLLDITPGALVSATFRFEGTLEAFGSGPVYGDPAAVPARTTAATSLSFYLPFTGRELAVSPLASLPVVVRTQAVGMSAEATLDGSERRAFEVTLPGSVYQDVWGEGSFHFGEVEFGIDPLLVGPTKEMLFRGTASAVFTYLTADELAGVPLPVPEPASWALLGLGLAGLVAARRRGV